MEAILFVIPTDIWALLAVRLDLKQGLEYPLKNRPLLCIAGQKDNKVPVSTFHPVIDRIASVSDQKDLLIFIVWLNLEHTVTKPVLDYSIQLLKTFLVQK
jgi:hypothetical protein